MLNAATPMGFIPTRDFVTARAFYEGVLGLSFISQDDFALVLRSGSIQIRLTRPPQLSVAAYTVFGWQVSDICDTVAQLTAKGVVCELYDFFGNSQGPDGVWTAPGGDKVAWFKDPDGNLLSVSQHMV